MKKKNYSISLDLLEAMGENSEVFDAVLDAMHQHEATGKTVERHSTPAGNICIESRETGEPVITFCND